MENIKNWVKENRKMHLIAFIIICILIIIGYVFCQNEQKQRILESMNITFNEISEIEYGTKDYDVEKELIKEVKNAKIKDIPNIDTMKIGEQTLQFILVNNGLEKEIDYKIQIKDTKAPEITFKEDKIELTVGDECDIKSNIGNVKDPIDGDIKEIEKASEINKKVTEEYNKLKKEDIKNDTKVAETSLNEFFIEDIQDKDEKNLYLKNCYYIDSKLDTSKSGEYKVDVVAVDRNGLKTEKKYTITVKEKRKTTPSVIQSNHTSTENNSLPYKDSSNHKKGSIQNVMSTANAQVGKKYVLGGRGPDSFDCDGLVLYAFKQNGYAMPSSSRRAGYSIGTDLSNAQAGDIIVTAHHVRLYLGGMNSVQALNPSDGIQSGFDRDLDVWFRCHVYNDPNYSNPIEIIDIRRVR